MYDAINVPPKLLCVGVVDARFFGRDDLFLGPRGDEGLQYVSYNVENNNRAPFAPGFIGMAEKFNRWNTSNLSEPRTMSS